MVGGGGVGRMAYNRTQIQTRYTKVLIKCKLEVGGAYNLTYFFCLQVDGPITKGEGVKKMKHTVFPLLLSPPEDPQDKNDHFLF